MISLPEMALCTHPEHELTRTRDAQRRCLILQVGKNLEARYEISDLELVEMPSREEIKLRVLLWIADVCAYDKGEDREARAEAVKARWQAERQADIQARMVRP